MKKKEVIKIEKLEKGETFIKMTSPYMNPASSNATESPYDRVRWCARAVSKDENRPAINCIYIDDTYLCATDGMRLHLTWNDYGYAPGLYHVLLCNNKQILLERDADLELKDYAEFQRVIPYEGCSNGIKPLMLNENDKTRMSRLLYHVYTNTGMLFDMKYLEDAAIPESELRFQTHKNKMLVMASEDCNRIALVMAMK